jgi:hypothetical protein
MARFDSVGAFVRILTVFFTDSVLVQAVEPIVESLHLRAGRRWSVPSSQSCC